MNSCGYQNRKDLTKLKSSKKPRDSSYKGGIRRIHEETREPDMYNVHVRIQKLYRIPSFKPRHYAIPYSCRMTHLVTEKPYTHTYTHSIHLIFFNIRHHLPKTNHEDMTQEIARDRTNLST